LSSPNRLAYVRFQYARVADSVASSASSVFAAYVIDSRWINRV
jgi:hypothetical protein